MAPSPPPLPSWLEQAEPWLRVSAVVGFLLMGTVISSGWNGYVTDQRDLVTEQRKLREETIKLNQTLVMVCEDQKRLMAQIQTHEAAIRDLQVGMAAIRAGR